MSDEIMDLDDTLDEDDSSNLITLTDEDGTEQTFEIIDVLEEGDVQYFACVPVFDSEEDSLEDDGDLVILKEVVEDGEEFLATIDDDEEFDKISGIFMERLEEYYEFTEE